MGETNLSTQGIAQLVHPLDIVEAVMNEESWAYERTDADSLNLDQIGEWATYTLNFNWVEDLESLHLASGFELKVPPIRLKEVRELVRLINEQMWIGHFDLWQGDTVMLYRYALMLPGGSELSMTQCREMVRCAVSTGDSYFPAFQHVIWAGQSAQTALEAIQFVTAGEA